MSEQVTEREFKDLREAFDVFTKKVDKGLLADGERDRLASVFDQHDELQAKATAAEAAAENAKETIEELKTALEDSKANAGQIRERVEEMQVEMARKAHLGSEDPNAFRDTPEFKAFDGWLRKGDSRIDDETKQLLRTDRDDDGGVLTMIEMDTEMIRAITEIDGMRRVARVRTIGSKGLSIPVRTGIPVATYEGEAEDGGVDTSKYGAETLTPYRQTVTIPVTRDMLQDSEIPIESEIMTDAGEAFAFGEGESFITGNGVKVPTGFLTNAAVLAAAYQGGTGVLDPEDIMRVQGNLKFGYNPSFMLNRRVLSSIRVMRSDSGAGAGTGHFLWSPALDGGATPTLAGTPYVISNSMPDEATGNFPLAYGDFRRGYTIVDRTGISVIRDEVTRKKASIVEFTLQRWNTGQVVLPEAIQVVELQ